MISLRPYQQDAVNSIYEYFEKKGGHPLLVLPTASGKSLVMASFIESVLKQYPDERILILAHVRELIAQNHAEMLALWPDCPAGVYSAGMGRREARAQVLFAGIQSVHRRAQEIGAVNLLLIDESHLVPRESNATYVKFIAELTTINPHLKVIGFTATPFRLGSGLLTEGKDALFSDIAYSVSMRTLIDMGYLAPLVTKATHTALNVSGVHKRGGEYIESELQAAVDRDEITNAAIAETVVMGQDRKAWLAFCSGVNHAHHVRDAFRAHGIACETIVGTTPKDERDSIIARFKAGEIRCLAAMNVLTTGFNATSVDLIAMLRPTASVGLYVQMAGRGTRLHSGKKNCLVLDFAGNIARHGPVDLVEPKRPGKGDGVAPVKTCPQCFTIHYTGVRVCSECGYVFPEPKPEIKIERKASSLDILSTGEPEWLTVDDVSYAIHHKIGSPDTLRVDYWHGFSRYSKWFCYDHPKGSYPHRLAVAFWNGKAPVPASVKEAFERSGELSAPAEIRTRLNGKYQEIVATRGLRGVSPRGEGLALQPASGGLAGAGR